MLDVSGGKWRFDAMINAGGAFSALGKWKSFCFYQYTCTPGKTFNYYSHLLISESERHNFL